MKSFNPASGRVWLYYLTAAIVSLLLSAWISARETVINPDGICYLMSAQAFNVMSFSQVMQLCPQSGWPFYPWLIHTVMSLTGASALVAANSLDAFFSLLSVLTFMGLVQCLGGSKRVIAFAGFIILFSHTFNSVRQYIVRDHGYYAFYLLSLICFIQYLQKPRIVTWLGWVISLGLATLFRIEGAVFFMLLPFVTLHRRYLSLTLFAPVIALGVCAALMNWLAPETFVSWHRVSELGQYLTQSGSAMLTRFNETKTALAVHVLPIEGARDAGTVWFLALLIFYVTSILENLSFIGAALVVYAWVKRAAVWSRPAKTAIWAYVAVNIIITLVFFAQHLFLSKRYLIALSLTLLLWAPFGLARLSEAALAGQRKLIYYTALFLVVLSSMGVILDRGPTKTYVRDAGSWIALNVPQTASLYVNDFQLMYYSQHEGFDIFKKIPIMRNPTNLADGLWKHYEYVALRIRGDDTRWASIAIAMNQQPVKTFSGPHGDTVLIYKITA